MAQVKGFYIGEALRRAWRAFKGNMGLFILVMVIAIVINVGFNVGQTFAMRFSKPLGLAIMVVSQLIGVAIGMGIIRVALNVADGKGAAVGDMFGAFPLLLKGICASLLYSLIVVGGMFLLVIPGIIWTLKFQFALFFVVDEGMGPIAALKKSAAITDGAKWDLFGLAFVVMCLSFLGALACGIGLFVAWPVVWLTYALVFRALSTQTFGQVYKAPPPAPDSEFYGDVRVGQ